MERALFGYVVHHAYDERLPMCFAVHELVGAELQVRPRKRVILRPSPALRELLTAADPHQGTIDRAVLELTPTGPAPFQYKWPRTGTVTLVLLCADEEEEEEQSEAADSEEDPAQQQQEQEQEEWASLHPIFRGRPNPSARC
jgi:hypothetical protein